jgi:hypothetical protein
VVNRFTGEVQWEVGVFVKRPGQTGEEIRVALPGDVGEGFEEGSVVELVQPTVSPYSFKNDKNETVAGVTFRAAGLKPAPASKPGPALKSA